MIIHNVDEQEKKNKILSNQIRIYYTKIYYIYIYI